MSPRGKNKTPWRSSGPLWVSYYRSPSTPPPELDMSVIVEAIAKARVVTETRKCEACQANLRAAKKGTLCSACERGRTIVEGVRCGCGRRALHNCAKVCKLCLQEHSDQIKRESADMIHLRNTGHGRASA